MRSFTLGKSRILIFIQNFRGTM